MKIAFALTQLEAGGAQTRVFATAKLLRQLGHEVDVYPMYRKRDAFVGEPMEVLSERGGLVGLTIASIRLYRELRAGAYDALVANGVVAAVFGSIAGMLAGIDNRVAVQTLAPANRKRVYNLVDALWGSIGIYRINIANSAWTYRQFAKYPRSYRERLRIVTNGIEPLTATERLTARHELSIDPSEFRFITVGRLHPQKNQRVLVEALARVPGATLAILGDGELKSELHQLALDRGVADRIEFLGERSRTDVALHLSAADAYVFASLWESFGLATVEAASVGLPLLVSDIDIHREVLGVAQAGEPVYVDPLDVGAWADAMTDLMRRTPERRAELARIGSEIAAEHSLLKHATRLVAVVESSTSDGVGVRE